MRDLISGLVRAFSIFENEKALAAILSWPKFSVASFLIASRLKKQGIRPSGVIDVGANVGQFSVAIAKTFPGVAVHAFDPDPATIRKLENNIKKLPQIKTYTMAIGDIQGEARFLVNRDNQVSSILPPSQNRLDAYPDSTVAQEIQVRLDTLENLFPGTPLGENILLKIDAQGYEDKVLKGCGTLFKNVAYVLIEVSMKPLYEGEKTFPEMLDLLKGLGFVFLRPLNWHISPQNGEVIEMDVLFAHASRLENGSLLN